MVIFSYCLEKERNMCGLRGAEQKWSYFIRVVFRKKTDNSVKAPTPALNLQSDADITPQQTRW